MSLLLNELLGRCSSPLYDQHFGLGVLGEELLEPSIRLLSGPLRSGYARPWRTQEARDSSVSSLTTDQGGFQVHLDVQQFRPEELSVRVVDDFVVIEGKHEEREDEHGLVSRHFVRKYKIPPSVDPQALQSRLSSDGVLMLRAPVKVPAPGNVREIPITFTNAPAVKQQEKETKQVEGS